MTIRAATTSDLHNWVALRVQLWSDTSLGQHNDEAGEILAGSFEDGVAFLDVSSGDIIRGFAEASIRRDHVNGCESSPVAFLEGIFVRPDHQGSGIGRQLLKSVQSWALERGVTELASDAHIDNVASQAFDRVVYFRKPL